jgi:3-methylcrotonyl-CoA carboxylase alpha subunit
MTVTRVGDGMYRVDAAGRADIVYVAGASNDAWAFSNGEVFRTRAADEVPAKSRPRAGRAVAAQIAAPMPATVLKVNVKPGDTVAKGDVLVVLEAMKMELPIRAPGPGTVTAVSCREGELVQADAVLVALGPGTA